MLDDSNFIILQDTSSALGANVGKNDISYFNAITIADFDIRHYERNIRKYRFIIRYGWCFIYCALQKSCQITFGIISLLWGNYNRNYCSSFSTVVATSYSFSHACSHYTLPYPKNYFDPVTKAILY